MNKGAIEYLEGLYSFADNKGQRGQGVMYTNDEGELVLVLNGRGYLVRLESELDAAAAEYAACVTSVRFEQDYVCAAFIAGAEWQRSKGLT